MTEGEIIALITLGGVILANIIPAFVQNNTLKRRLDAVDKRFDDVEEHNKEQYLDILRLTIMSEEMPVSERIIAGQKYIDKGGNGDVKKFYEEFLKKHTQ